MSGSTVQAGERPCGMIQNLSVSSAFKSVDESLMYCVDESVRIVCGTNNDLNIVSSVKAKIWHDA